MNIQTPDWVKNAVFYQIFPDRFARSGQVSVKGIQFKAWGTPPDEQGFQGGDLYGIISKLDYLLDLGINAIYLNPIFASAANHRYHTFDYYQVDPLLGGNDALRQLLDAAHARGIKVILDGVFNHASRGFWPFHHILETGGNSPYVDWFHIEDWPLRPYTSNADNPANYESWFDIPSLPKFNTNNAGVRDYLMGVARYWLEFGIDGWRLDVPNEIDDDSFWQEFRQVVKGVNPDAYICGEIWEDGRRWLQGDQFDAVMNYLFTAPALNFCGGDSIRTEYTVNEFKFAPIDAPAFAHEIEKMYGLYDWEINYAQMNMLDSHDMARALWILQGDKTALRLTLLLQMTLPGAPSVYYGDEIGMAAGGDPDCREAFPWADEGQWDHDLLAYYRQVIGLRRRYAALRTGGFEMVYADGGVLVYKRPLSPTTLFIAINTGKEETAVSIPCQLANLHQIWPQQQAASHTPADGMLTITVPAREAIVLWHEE